MIARERKEFIILGREIKEDMRKVEKYEKGREV